MTAVDGVPVVFAPVTRASVSEDVYRQLRNAILTGQLAAGTALAGERSLAEQFAVNRHAVREVMRRLEQARLVEVSHGGATRVRDWRTQAGLELLSELGTAGDLSALPIATLLRSVLEMRLAVGADAARLAALRITPEAAAALRAHVEAVGAASTPPELETVSESYDVLWRLIVAASDNIAYQLADNTLVDALRRLPELALELSRPEFSDLDAQRDLVAAIAAHHADRAAEIARELLSRMAAQAQASAAKSER